jgi:hypothetical protein
MMQTWNAKMDFKESAMTETKALEASFNVRLPLPYPSSFSPRRSHLSTRATELRLLLPFTSLGVCYVIAELLHEHQSSDFG